MIPHYFKIAFRNLLKYKTQSIISIIGLAVGITCFALATLWIRYEMTYDTFHRRADDIYLVRAQLTITDGTLSNSMPYPAIEYLRKNISEIEDICGISPFKTNLRFKDKGGDLLAIEVDSAFIRMFDVRILQGNVNFLKKKSMVKLQYLPLVAVLRSASLLRIAVCQIAPLPALLVPAPKERLFSLRYVGDASHTLHYVRS